MHISAMIVLGLLAVFQLASIGAAPSPDRMSTMVGPQFMLRGLLQASRFGPSMRMVKMMHMIENECAKRLNVKLPDSLAVRPQPEKAAPAPTEDDAVSEEDDSDNEPSSPTKAADVTYDMVRNRAIGIMTNVSRPLDMQSQMVDNMLKGAEDGAKFMAGLNAQQMKDMLLCMHTVAMQEPLAAEKKGLQLAKQLTCEVAAKMQNQPADKCPK